MFSKEVEAKVRAVAFMSKMFLVLVGSGKMFLYNGTADVFNESQGQHSVPVMKFITERSDVM